MSDEIAFLSAVELGRQIAAGKRTSVAATQAMLDRIAKYDAHLGAFERVLGDDALKAAAELDAELAQGKSRGPLHGVPVAVKDLCDVAGYPSAGQSPAGLSMLTH